MKSLSSITDFNSHEVLVRPVSDTVNALVLLANSVASTTIPAGATRVIMTTTAPFYCSIGTSSVTAVIPNSSISNGTSSILNPIGFALDPTMTTISCISSVAATITFEYYS